MSAHRGWRTDAACREMSGELFFPTAANGLAYDAQVAHAKAICAGCPVRAQCLDEALVMLIAIKKSSSEQRRCVVDMSATRPALATTDEPGRAGGRVAVLGRQLWTGSGRGAGAPPRTPGRRTPDVDIALAGVLVEQRTANPPTGWTSKTPGGAIHITLVRIPEGIAGGLTA